MTAEEITQELKARIATLTVAQGAETDAGLRVFLGRNNINDTLIPCTSIVESGDDPEHKGPNTLIATADSFLLFAFVPCDPADPSVAAHAALRDIKRAIFRTNGKPSRTWGGKVTDIKYRGSDIGARSDGAAFVCATIKLAIDHVTDLANP